MSDEELVDDSSDQAPIRPLSGIDLAKAALAQAREDARARGRAPVPRTSRRGGRGTRAPAHPGDPELLGASVRRLLAERGWEVETAVASVTERWPEIAGADLAEHCRPEKFEDGVLTLVAESTTWASQVRLLRGTLQGRLDEVVGRGTVTSIKVHGPTSPSWAKGPLRVKGRGPRDTYG